MALELDFHFSLLPSFLFSLHASRRELHILYSWEGTRYKTVMGFFQKFFSIGSRRSKKQRKRMDAVDCNVPPMPDLQRQYEDQEATISRMLRSSSAHLADPLDVDCSQLPPLRKSSDCDRVIQSIERPHSPSYQPYFLYTNRIYHKPRKYVPTRNVHCQDTSPHAAFTH